MNARRVMVVVGGVLMCVGWACAGGLAVATLFSATGLRAAEDDLQECQSDLAPAGAGDPYLEMQRLERLYGSAPAGGAGAAPPPAPPADAFELAEDEVRSASSTTGLADLTRGEGEAEPQPEATDDSPVARAWFPESFLWRPLVETGAEGTSTVDLTVPDQLTTWRLLALAHSQAGSQAGAVHTFDSSLPLYVDPVVPGWLFAGDVVELPVQVVNTSGDPVDARLVVEASGALSGEGVSEVRLGAGGSALRAVELEAVGAGVAQVRAELVGRDAAIRQVPVSPSGRPVRNSRGGTVSSERRVSIEGPAQADPTTQQLRVQVFSGPLAVLQAEVERVGSGGATPAGAAYGFALASRMSELAARSGAEVDEDAIRRLQVLAWQRVVRLARAPDPGVATDLLWALSGVEDHELAEALEERLVRTVVQGQRGDGTWARSEQTPLRQVLVHTACSGRALPVDEEGARLRASGALERYARDVDDPFTAAVVLASGLVEGHLADTLRAEVLEGVHEGADGTRTVVVPPDALDAWGHRPPKAEALGWTVLALADADDLDWRGDLVAELMSGYDASRGFGAGPADVIVLEAVTSSLPGVDQPVTVVLSVDGVEVDRSRLDPAQPKVPAVLSAAPRGQAVQVDLRVEPASPGLAFTAELSSWVPWTGAEELPGVEVEVEAERLSVGRESTVTLRMSAPSGEALVVEQGLPAGAVVDEQALTDAAVVESFAVRTDRVVLTTRAFQAGEVIEVPLRVRPAFAGRFSTAPLTVGSARPGGAAVELPPLSWEVSPG